IHAAHGVPVTPEPATLVLADVLAPADFRPRMALRACLGGVCLIDVLELQPGFVLQEVFLPAPGPLRQLLPRGPRGPALLVRVPLDTAHVTGNQADTDDGLRAGLLLMVLRPCCVDFAGEPLRFRSDLVVEVMQTPFGLRLDLLLRRLQAPVLTGAVLA